jgi:CBS domain containing-hemolysin-like protein
VVALAAAAVLIDRAFLGFMGPASAGLFAVVSAVLVYATFAEVLGTIARRRPEEVGRLALRWLRPLEYLVLVVAEPLTLLGRWASGFVPERGTSSDARHTETEVEWLVSMGERAGALEKEPATMIRNVLDFWNLTA